MHEPHFRPWGTVSPAYWATGDDAIPGEGSGPDALASPQPPRSHPLKAGMPDGSLSAQSPRDLQTEVTTRQSDTSAETSVAAADAGPPPAFKDRVASITAAFEDPSDRQRLAAAGAEAEKLDQELTAQYGQHHIYTINLRELRGWLAHLSGDANTAARWYLHTTGLKIHLFGTTHLQTQDSARRAVHTWQQVADPVDIVQIGTDLAKVVSAVLGTDSDAARFLRSRVSQYQQQGAAAGGKRLGK